MVTNTLFIKHTCFYQDLLITHINNASKINTLLKCTSYRRYHPNTHSPLMSTHGCHKLPPIRFGNIHLDRTQVYSSVIATDGIQFSAVGNQSHPAAHGVHGCDVRPLFRDGVVHFRCEQEGASVVATTDVNFAVEGGNAQPAAFGEHGRHGHPLAHQRIVSFDLQSKEKLYSEDN